MKREKRVLVIGCKEGCCCGVVLRGWRLIDWAGCAPNDAIGRVFCTSSASGEVEYAYNCEGGALPACTSPYPDIVPSEACSLVHSIVEKLIQLLSGCPQRVA